MAHWPCAISPTASFFQAFPTKTPSSCRSQPSGPRPSRLSLPAPHQVLLQVFDNLSWWSRMSALELTFLRPRLPLLADSPPSGQGASNASATQASLFAMLTALPRLTALTINSADPECLLPGVTALTGLRSLILPALRKGQVCMGRSSLCATWAWLRILVLDWVTL